VVGTFDGETFTLTEEPGAPAKHLQQEDGFSSSPACDEPKEGWVTQGAVDQEAAGRALAQVRREPDYAAGWVTQLEPPGATEDTGPVVLNAAFTGDIERHKAELRKLWAGSLCVARYEHSLDELEHLRRSVDEELESREIAMLYSDLDEIRGRLVYHVTYLTADDEDHLTTRFGKTLRITAALTPVNE
jgi:hypothetical protein